MADVSQEAKIPMGTFLDLEAIGRLARVNEFSIQDIVDVVMQRLEGYHEDPVKLQRLAAQKAASFVVGLFAIHEHNEPVCISYPVVNMGEKE